MAMLVRLLRWRECRIGKVDHRARLIERKSGINKQSCMANVKDQFVE